MDYDSGIRKLRSMVSRDPDALLSAALQESRLRDNLSRARTVGENPIVSSERNEVLQELNRLVLKHSGNKQTFADLCHEPPTDESQQPLSLRSAVPNLGSETDKGPDWIQWRLREAISGMARVDRECGFNESDYVDVDIAQPTRAAATYRVVKAAAPQAQDASPVSTMLNDERRYNRVIDVFQRVGPHLVLLGDPGSGKSVSLRRLGQDIASRQLDDKWTGKSNLLPVYIHLGDYVAKTAQGKPEDFRTFVLGTTPSIGPGEAREADRNLTSLAQRGELVFLLDSMDEMPRDDYSERYDAIRLFMAASPLCRFVFACRKVDYDHRLQVAEIHVEPISRQQINSFVKHALVRTSPIRRRWLQGEVAVNACESRRGRKQECSQ